MTDQPRIAVLDYGIGNLRSAQKALQRVGGDAFLTRDHSLIRNADAVVLPGVGAFGACMEAVREADLETVIHDRIDAGVPFLGICVGMQMLFDASQENDDAVGLGVIPGVVEWIPDLLPRPQMQWNQVNLLTPDPMFEGIESSPWMYFVHSFHAVPRQRVHTVGTVHYGETLNVVFRRDNVFATQFHPEKSAHAGLAMLKNFVKWAQL